MASCSLMKNEIVANRFFYNYYVQLPPIKMPEEHDFFLSSFTIKICYSFTLLKSTLMFNVRTTVLSTQTHTHTKTHKSRRN